MKQSHKTLILWVMLILMFAAIWQLVEGGERPRPVAFSEFVSEVQEGRVQSVDIRTRQNTAEYSFQRKKDIDGQQQARQLSVGVVDENINKMLLEKGVEVTFIPEDRTGQWGGILITWIPVVFLLVVVLFFMRQLQATGGKAMSFGRARARLLNESANKITFDDVAGIEEAKDDCEEIIAFLKDPKKFQRLGGHIPKGVLLMGAPGTGKTLLARAIAGEAGVPFFSISGSDFVEMFVGVGASRVRDLFEQGKKNAPCIIFIDEIDAVGRHRGAGLGGGHDEREQTLNQLLVEMDGFESNEGVIIIAATNRPDVLDPAILRPGRFDRRIIVPRPDMGGRAGILGVHTKKVPLGEDVDLELLARGTPGFSGADIENLVNEAALLAARLDKNEVSMIDFEMAKDKVMMGSERRSMIISEQEKRRSAWHEAGHTVVGNLLPSHDPVHKVSIIPRGPALGMTMSLPKEDRLGHSKEWALDRIGMALGGRVAEEIAMGELTTGAADDFRQATSLAHAMVVEWGMSETMGPLAYGEREESILPFMPGPRRAGYSEQTAKEIDAEVRRIVMEQYERIKKLLLENREKLDAVATALLERETLDREEIEAVMAGRELPERKRIEVPRYSEKSKKRKEKRKEPIFQPRPSEVPTGS